MIKRLFNSIWILLICTALPFSCKAPDTSQPPEIIRPVKYGVISYASNDAARTFLGTARSDREIELSFRTSGIVTTLNIRVGQEVKEGDLLAQLDNTEAILSLEQAVSSLTGARSIMNTAGSTLARTRTLYEQGSASLSDYEAAKSAFADARANFESANRTVDIRKKQVKYGTIYAPTAGIIASRNVEVNENVGAGEVVAVLNAGQKMEVSLGIPENAINKVTKGMMVDIAFSSLKDKQFRGIVSEISPSVDANTATYPVRIRISDPSPEIKSGMAANVTVLFEKEDAQKKLVVPVSAVGEDSKGNFVFVIISDDGKTGSVQKKHVTIGTLTPEGFIVKLGLDAGTKVATAGLQHLLEGQKVALGHIDER